MLISYSKIADAYMGIIVKLSVLFKNSSQDRKNNGYTEMSAPQCLNPMNFFHYILFRWLRVVFLLLTWCSWVL